MLRPAWIFVNGITVLFATYALVVWVLLSGRLPIGTIALLLAITAGAGWGIALLRGDQVDSAAKVGALLALPTALLANDLPIPMSLPLWTHAGVMVWGFATTHSPSVPGTLRRGQQASAASGWGPKRVWNILTVVPLGIGLLCVVLATLLVAASADAADGPNASGWEGLGMLVGIVVGVIAAVIVVVGAILLVVSKRTERVAAGLSLPLSLAAIFVGVQDGGLLSTIMVSWGLLYSLSAVGLLGDSSEAQLQPPPPGPPVAGPNQPTLPSLPPSLTAPSGVRSGN